MPTPVTQRGIRSYAMTVNDELHMKMEAKARHVSLYASYLADFQFDHFVAGIR